jgi:hypothetical protein
MVAALPSGKTGERTRVYLATRGAGRRGQNAACPLSGPGLLVRVAPFAAVAVLAEASLALGSGPGPSVADGRSAWCFWSRWRRRSRCPGRICRAGCGSAAALASQPEVRERILASADALDQVLRLTRDAVFGLEHRLQGRGLRAEIGALVDQVSPAPEISFTGPVDGALDPARTTQLVQALGESLQLKIPHAAPNRVAIATSDTIYTAEIETSWTAPDNGTSPEWISQIVGSTPGPGIRVTVHQAPAGTRITWSVPLKEPQPG